MKCKKGDFGGVKDLNVSLKNRKILYYCICIWIRLGLIYLAYRFCKAKWFPYIIGIIVIILLYFVKFDKAYCVWWSRKLHYIMLCIILIISVIQIILKDNKPLIPLLLLIDLILGISSSFILKWY